MHLTQGWALFQGGFLSLRVPIFEFLQGSERGAYAVAQPPNANDRRARHIAQWLAAPPRSQSTMTAATGQDSTEYYRTHAQHQHARRSSSPGAHEHWREGMSDSPPALGVDGRKPVIGGASGVLPFDAPKAASAVSGISIGGASRLSDGASVAGTSWGDGQHANVTAFRRITASRHSPRNSDPNPSAPPTARQDLDALKRTQDTSCLGVTTSTQITTEGGIMTGHTGLSVGTTEDQQSNGEGPGPQQWDQDQGHGQGSTHAAGAAGGVADRQSRSSSKRHSGGPPAMRHPVQSSPLSAISIPCTIE
jgi:hypothetical protein